jgi:hypothetical protein
MPLPPMPLPPMPVGPPVGSPPPLVAPAVPRVVVEPPPAPGPAGLVVEESVVEPGPLVTDAPPAPLALLACLTSPEPQA